MSAAGVTPYNCTLCAAGKQSNAANTNCIACTNGLFIFYIPIVLVGYSCANPDLGPEACPAGTYSSSTNSTACIQCPAGYYCPVASSVPLQCANGYYSSSGGVVNCTICAAGNSCLDKVNQIPCVSGQYSLAGAIACTNCPRGSEVCLLFRF